MDTKTKRFGGIAIVTIGLWAYIIMIKIYHKQKTGCNIEHLHRDHHEKLSQNVQWLGIHGLC